MPTLFEQETLIIREVFQGLADQHRAALEEISRAATAYMEAITPMAWMNDSSVGARDYPLVKVAGVRFCRAGKDIFLHDGCDVFPAVRVVALQRPVPLVRGMNSVNLDLTISEGATLCAAFEAMARLMEQAKTRVNHLAHQYREDKAA